MALGAVQTGAALKGLYDLKKQPLPEYDMTQAEKNVSMYQKRFNEGLSAEERAAMDQQFAGARAGFYRSASEQSRGSLSNFLGRISALDRIKYATQMGSMMAQERRAAMGGLAGARNTLMGQQNRQTAYQMQRRDSAERALGQAMQSGLYNAMTGATYGIASGMANGGAMGNLNTGATGTPNSGSTNALSLVGQPGTFANSQPYGPSDYVPTTNPLNFPPSMGGVNMGASFRSRFSTTPSFSNYLPQKMISVPDGQRTGNPASYSDMSGDPFYNQVYNPNALRFSNPYMMNRGFMNSYDASMNANGEIVYTPI
jgi:hypothetical protein